MTPALNSRRNVWSFHVHYFKNVIVLPFFFMERLVLQVSSLKSIEEDCLHRFFFGVFGTFHRFYKLYQAFILVFDFEMLST